MTSFSYFCIVWITICVDLLSAEPEFTVSGHVGSTAVLPCKLPSVDTETPHIKWSIKSQTVFERWGEDTYQGEGYEDHVDVPEDELCKGNCSLVLYNLTLNDAEVYMSYQAVKSTKIPDRAMTNWVRVSRVELSVSEKPAVNDKTKDLISDPTEKPEDKTSASRDWKTVIGVIGVIGVILGIVFLIWKYKKFP